MATLRTSWLTIHCLFSHQLHCQSQSTPVCPPQFDNPLFVVNDAASCQAWVTFEYKSNCWKTFQNFCQTILDILEDYINITYCKPVDTIVTGFDTIVPCQVISLLQQSYGKATEEEMWPLHTHAKQLSYQCHVQGNGWHLVTTVSFFNGNHHFFDQQLIDVGHIKLKRTGGMYSKK